MTDRFRLDQIFTASEAEEKWRLQPGTVRSSCTRGQLKSYIEKGLVRKSGNTWLVTEKAMNIVYGRNDEMKVWKREGYIIEEREFDYDLHEFVIIVDGKERATITPDTIEDMESIIEELDNGADPVAEGWEDGLGNTITID